MDFESMSEELKAKAMACKSTEELVALAKSEGVELTEEQLAQIDGGMLGWLLPGVCLADSAPIEPAPDNPFRG